jgi:hypothetical protein
MTDDTPQRTESLVDTYDRTCMAGHVRVDDGSMPDGTKLWHCAKCDAGVRRPMEPKPKPMGEEMTNAEAWTFAKVGIGYVLLVTAILVALWAVWR